jgi:hypothetical protein
LNGRIRAHRLLAAAGLGAALAVALAQPTGAPVPRPGAVAPAAARPAPPRASVPRPRPLYTVVSVRVARRWAATRPGLVAFAVLGEEERLRGWRRDVTFPSASVVKAMLMLAELRAARPVPPAILPVLRKMVTESDNEAALAIYARVGREGLERVARAARMARFGVPTSLFDARVTAADLVRLFIRVERLVPRAHRRLARRLLGSIVPPQRWGIAEVGRRHGMAAFFKGGWRDGLVHQAALLEGRGRRRVALAVLTSAQPSFVTGAATIEGIAARVLVGPRRPGGPGQPIRSRMTVFTTNRTANRIVQRSRLRSMSEPPVVPPATPTPKAPDIPASFPECSSTRKIRTTAMKTWTTERTAYIGSPGYYGRGSPPSPAGRSCPAASRHPAPSSPGRSRARSSTSSRASRRCSTSTASRRSWRSSPRQSASESLPVR